MAGRKVIALILIVITGLTFVSPVITWAASSKGSCMPAVSDITNCGNSGSGSSSSGSSSSSGNNNSTTGSTGSPTCDITNPTCFNTEVNGFNDPTTIKYVESSNNMITITSGLFFINSKIATTLYNDQAIVFETGSDEALIPTDTKNQFTLTNISTIQNSSENDLIEVPLNVVMDGLQAYGDWNGYTKVVSTNSVTGFFRVFHNNLMYVVKFNKAYNVELDIMQKNSNGDYVIEVGEPQQFTLNAPVTIGSTDTTVPIQFLTDIFKDSIKGVDYEQNSSSGSTQMLIVLYKTDVLPVKNGELSNDEQAIKTALERAFYTKDQLVNLVDFWTSQYQKTGNFAGLNPGNVRQSDMLNILPALVNLQPFGKIDIPYQMNNQYPIATLWFDDNGAAKPATFANILSDPNISDLKFYLSTDTSGTPLTYNLLYKEISKSYTNSGLDALEGDNNPIYVLDMSNDSIQSEFTLAKFLAALERYAGNSDGDNSTEVKYAGFYNTENKINGFFNGSNNIDNIYNMYLCIDNMGDIVDNAKEIIIPFFENPFMVTTTSDQNGYLESVYSHAKYIPGNDNIGNFNVSSDKTGVLIQQSGSNYIIRMTNYAHLASDSKFKGNLFSSPGLSNSFVGAKNLGGSVNDDEVLPTPNPDNSTTNPLSFYEEFNTNNSIFQEVTNTKGIDPAFLMNIPNNPNITQPSNSDLDSTYLGPQLPSGGFQKINIYKNSSNGKQCDNLDILDSALTFELANNKLFASGIMFEPNNDATSLNPLDVERLNPSASQQQANQMQTITNRLFDIVTEGFGYVLNLTVDNYISKVYQDFFVNGSGGEAFNTTDITQEPMFKTVFKFIFTVIFVLMILLFAYQLIMLVMGRIEPKRIFADQFLLIICVVVPLMILPHMFYSIFTTISNDLMSKETQTITIIGLDNQNKSFLNDNQTQGQVNLNPVPDDTYITIKDPSTSSSTYGNTPLAIPVNDFVRARDPQFDNEGSNSVSANLPLYTQILDTFISQIAEQHPSFYNDPSFYADPEGYLNLQGYTNITWQPSTSGKQLQNIDFKAVATDLAYYCATQIRPIESYLMPRTIYQACALEVYLSAFKHSDTGGAARYVDFKTIDANTMFQALIIPIQDSAAYGITNICNYVIMNQNLLIGLTFLILLGLVLAYGIVMMVIKIILMGIAVVLFFINYVLYKDYKDKTLFGFAYIFGTILLIQIGFLLVWNCGIYITNSKSTILPSQFLSMLLVIGYMYIVYIALRRLIRNVIRNISDLGGQFYLQALSKMQSRLATAANLLGNAFGSTGLKDIGDSLSVSSQLNETIGNKLAEKNALYRDKMNNPLKGYHISKKENEVIEELNNLKEKKAVINEARRDARARGISTRSLLTGEGIKSSLRSIKDAIFRTKEKGIKSSEYVVDDKTVEDIQNEISESLEDTRVDSEISSETVNLDDVKKAGFNIEPTGEAYKSANGLMEVSNEEFRGIHEFADNLGVNTDGILKLDELDMSISKDKIRNIPDKIGITSDDSRDIHEFSNLIEEDVSKFITNSAVEDEKLDQSVTSEDLNSIPNTVDYREIKRFNAFLAKKGIEENERELLYKYTGIGEGDNAQYSINGNGKDLFVQFKKFEDHVSKLESKYGKSLKYSINKDEDGNLSLSLDDSLKSYSFDASSEEGKEFYAKYSKFKQEKDRLEQEYGSPLEFTSKINTDGSLSISVDEAQSKKYVDLDNDEGRILAEKYASFKSKLDPIKNILGNDLSYKIIKGENGEETVILNKPLDYIKDKLAENTSFMLQDKLSILEKLSEINDTSLLSRYSLDKSYYVGKESIESAKQALISSGLVEGKDFTIDKNGLYYNNDAITAILNNNGIESKIMSNIKTSNPYIKNLLKSIIPNSIEYEQGLLTESAISNYELLTKLDDINKSKGKIDIFNDHAISSIGVDREKFNEDFNIFRKIANKNGIKFTQLDDGRIVFHNNGSTGYKELVATMLQNGYSTEELYRLDSLDKERLSSVGIEVAEGNIEKTDDNQILVRKDIINPLNLSNEELQNVLNGISYSLLQEASKIRLSGIKSVKLVDKDSEEDFKAIGLTAGIDYDKSSDGTIVFKDSAKKAFGDNFEKLPKVVDLINSVNNDIVINKDAFNLFKEHLTNSGVIYDYNEFEESGDAVVIKSRDKRERFLSFREAFYGEMLDEIQSESIKNAQSIISRSGISDRPISEISKIEGIPDMVGNKKLSIVTVNVGNDVMANEFLNILRKDIASAKLLNDAGLDINSESQVIVSGGKIKLLVGDPIGATHVDNIIKKAIPLLNNKEVGVKIVGLKKGPVYRVISGEEEGGMFHSGNVNIVSSLENSIDEDVVAREERILYYEDNGKTYFLDPLTGKFILDDQNRVDKATALNISSKVVKDKELLDIRDNITDIKLDEKKRAALQKELDQLRESYSKKDIEIKIDLTKHQQEIKGLTERIAEIVSSRLKSSNMEEGSLKSELYQLVEEVLEDKQSIKKNKKELELELIEKGYSEEEARILSKELLGIKNKVISMQRGDLLKRINELETILNN